MKYRESLSLKDSLRLVVNFCLEAIEYSIRSYDIDAYQKYADDVEDLIQEAKESTELSTETKAQYECVWHIFSRYDDLYQDYICKKGELTILSKQHNEAYHNYSESAIDFAKLVDFLDVLRLDFCVSEELTDD